MCPSHDPQICSFSFLAQNFSSDSGSWSIDWIGEKAFVKIHIEKIIEYYELVIKLRKEKFAF